MQCVAFERGAAPMASIRHATALRSIFKEIVSDSSAGPPISGLCTPGRHVAVFLTLRRVWPRPRLARHVPHRAYGRFYENTKRYKRGASTQRPLRNEHLRDERDTHHPLGGPTVTPTRRSADLPATPTRDTATSRTTTTHMAHGTWQSLDHRPTCETKQARLRTRSRRDSRRAPHRSGRFHGDPSWSASMPGPEMTPSDQ